MDYKELIRMLRQEARAIRENQIGSWAVGYEQAATAIETLLAEREAAGWISVEDRLPETLEPVLVTFLGFRSDELYSDAIAVLCDDGDWAWWSGGDFEDDCDVRVKITHWMPLPTPPDREQEEENDHET